MEEIPEKFLPIGTVVLLNGGNKRVMINGFCAITDKRKNEFWDYTGCIFPEGILDSNKTYMFNHSQISEVSYMGYSDQEEVEFKKNLDDIILSLDKVINNVKI